MMLTELLTAEANSRRIFCQKKAHDAKTKVTTAEILGQVLALEQQLETANFSAAALAHIAKIFPGEKERDRGTVAFAKDILAIEPSQGFEDDLALMALLTGGVEIAAGIEVFLNGLKNLTDEQRAEFDAIAAKHLDDISDFAVRTMGLDRKDIFNREKMGDLINPPEKPPVPSAAMSSDVLTGIAGIGEATAKRLAEYGVHNFHDLARLSDERMDELDRSVIPKGVKRARNWQQQAKAKLAER